MSMYYYKKLISGVRDVPSMTLAQYNALTNKPKLWIRTDAPEGDRGINADDIEYDNGVSVKEALDDNEILEKTVNGTTSPSGAIALGLSVNNYSLISAIPITSTGTQYATPVTVTVNDEHYVYVYDSSNNQKIASTSVSIRVLYKRR